MHRIAVRVLLIGCVGHPTLAHAQLAEGADAEAARSQQSSPTDQGAAEPCRGIQSDEDRLACYDRTFGRSDRLFEFDATRTASEKTTDAEPGGQSMLDGRWELEPESKEGSFHLTAYKPVYILAAFHGSSANTTPSSPGEGNTVAEALPLENTETKFQISFKNKLWQDTLGDFSDLWFGYTQSSRWQTLNAAESRPFRETDYEPELMLAFRTRYSFLGWEGRMASIAINHQSNGRSEPLSRSWNRVIGTIGFDRDDWTVTLRHWLRMNEDLKDDDNPDIEDYIGRADLLITRNWNGHEISAMFRHSLRDGSRSHGAAELDWSFPIRGGLSGYLQVFHGYGESLIDYNHSATFVGLGVSLVNWYEPATGQ
jgi:phospholipase A1